MTGGGGGQEDPREAGMSAKTEAFQRSSQARLGLRRVNWISKAEATGDFDEHC